MRPYTCDQVLQVAWQPVLRVRGDQCIASMLHNICAVAVCNRNTVKAAYRVQWCLLISFKAFTQHYQCYISSCYISYVLHVHIVMIFQRILSANFECRVYENILNCLSMFVLGSSVKDICKNTCFSTTPLRWADYMGQVNNFTLEPDLCRPISANPHYILWSAFYQTQLPLSADIIYGRPLTYLKLCELYIIWFTSREIVAQIWQQTVSLLSLGPSINCHVRGGSKNHPKKRDIITGRHLCHQYQAMEIKLKNAGFYMCYQLHKKLHTIIHII